MRWTANINENENDFKRLMIYDSGNDVYLFIFDQKKDGPSCRDYLYEDIDDVFDACREDYGITKNDWKEIPSPLEGCQHDWIAPVRVKGMDKGKPRWGRFQQLIDGKWIDIYT